MTFTNDDIFEVYLLDLVRWVRMSKVNMLFQNDVYRRFRIIDPSKDSAYATAYNRVRRIQCLRVGKCGSCNRDVDPRSKRRCTYHLEKEREYAAARWQRKKAS